MIKMEYLAAKKPGGKYRIKRFIPGLLAGAVLFAGSVQGISAAELQEAAETDAYAGFAEAGAPAETAEVEEIGVPAEAEEIGVSADGAETGAPADAAESGAAFDAAETTAFAEIFDPLTSDGAVDNGRDTESAEPDYTILSLPEFSQTFCEWDGSGNLVRETAFNFDGVPCLNNRGFFCAEYSYDSHGNRLTEEYFGLNELYFVPDSGVTDPKGDYIDTVNGYARAAYTWYTDAYGDSHTVTEDRYTADGERAELPGSYSFRRDTWVDGWIQASEYFNAEGKLTRPTGGYAQILYDYAIDQEKGTITQTKRYLDADGGLLTGSEGGARVVSVYTLRGFLSGDIPIEDLALDMLIPRAEQENKSDYRQLLLSREIFGADDARVIGSAHWHRSESTYTRGGSLLRTDYTDPDGEPILCEDGYASVVYTYDDSGRTIETDYLGVDGDLIKVLNGYAKVTYEYFDDNSTLIHYETYYGADGERTVTTYGYSRAEYEYNTPPEGEDPFDPDAGWHYQITYYDPVDEYTMCLNGYARIEYRFTPDAQSRRKLNERWTLYADDKVFEKYYGTDMELIDVKAGYSGWINERNEHGQVVRTTYMDEKWEPTRDDELQYASIAYEYKGTSANEQPSYERYYDENGDPCVSITSTYARSMVYGGPEHNILFSESFFDEKDEPDVSASTGAHRADYYYDGSLLQTMTRYMDTEGRAFTGKTGYAAMYREYNRDGRLLWEAFFGDDGKLVPGRSKYAAQVHSYDYSNHHTGEKYFNAEGEALTQSSGYASVYYGWDANGNTAVITYLNAEDEPVLIDGRARIEREYDDRHHMLYEAYFDTDFEPVLNSEGYAARKMAYDALTGLLMSTEYLDVDGNPVLIPQGYASYTQQYDVHGNLLERAYFDETGAPVMPASVGYARFERKCDTAGNMLEEAYYDAEGELIVNADNYAVLTQEFDANGVMNAVMYLGADRLPADTAFGYARREMTYDYQGNLTGEAYFDAELDPVSISKGYHRAAYTWDTDGHQLAESYFDAEGNPTEIPDGYAGHAE